VHKQNTRDGSPKSDTIKTESALLKKITKNIATDYFGKNMVKYLHKL